MTATEVKRLSPVERIVQGLPRSANEEYYLLPQAAELLDVGVGTLRRWISEPGFEEFRPSKVLNVGKNKHYLYTKQDVERIREARSARVEDFFGGMGRPRKWTPEQKRERQQLYSQAYYWSQKAALLREEDNIEEANKAHSHWLQIRQQLKDFGGVEYWRNKAEYYSARGFTAEATEAAHKAEELTRGKTNGHVRRDAQD